MKIKFNDTSPTTAKALDQFYTAPKVAQDCIDQVLDYYADQPFETIIEPSAGTGAFSRQLGSNCIALDLDPKAPDIQTADFLTWQPEILTGRCLVIGNPPFSGGAAMKFLNHAAAFADVVAFILPATFKKKSQQNRVASNMHLMYQQDIPSRSFSHAGRVVDVPCVLQIWERGDVPRQRHKLRCRHSHFERCSQAEADLVIRRIGAHAGTLKPLDVNWSAQSNIFLRAVGCNRAELLRRFQNLDLTGAAANGVGGGSINMSELVELYEAILKEEPVASPLQGIADDQIGKGAALKWRMPLHASSAAFSLAAKSFHLFNSNERDHLVPTSKAQPPLSNPIQEAWIRHAAELLERPFCRTRRCSTHIGGLMTTVYPVLGPPQNLIVNSRWPLLTMNCSRPAPPTSRSDAGSAAIR
ncbi:hypothetical protein [Sulfitobacter sp. 1A13679]|jgi:hypothetical protein|uniref:hypothetical protein n=1 Tax=Sulfitobacter TaxID=60136 RepID=UPI0037477C3E